ncbi:hypothetical protein [Kallotenue papyrolyticum]|uniref:hypothetical protein n=1 Tax=Kallotenue papyrolyticum TaxID=1325125 RepID=UPI000470DB7D|nr:hypothetical protein [Kallotenue papyrolyticum]
MAQPLPDEILARAIAEAVRALPEVVALDGGPLGALATYGREGRVIGVRLRPDGDAQRVEVRVVVRYTHSQTLPIIADRVRQRVRQTLQRLAPHYTTVDVVIADLSDDPPPEAPAV